MMKLSDFKNRVVVVTGASGGLGEVVARRLNQYGADLILVARSREPLENLASELRDTGSGQVLPIVCDISSEADVDKMSNRIRETFSKIDVLINNAGIGTYLPSQEMTNREMRTHFEVNFFGAFYCVKALLPLLKKSKESYVLNVASLFSLISFADVSVYAATKFALAGFSRGLRQELKGDGVHVGLLMPASINTPFQEKKVGKRKSPKFMILEPETVAEEIVTMIVKKKKEQILPKWIGPLIRMKTAFG